jgi:hypothetical protein
MTLLLERECPAGRNEMKPKGVPLLQKPSPLGEGGTRAARRGRERV